MLNTYCDADGTLRSYTAAANVSITRDDVCAQQLVLTTDAQRTLDTVRPWLATKESFVLIGPEGCGKQTLLRHAFLDFPTYLVATIHCNAQTSPNDVQDKIAQCCVLMNTNTGRVYKPKAAEHLVLYLKDLNLPKPDKWGTSSLVAFLQQIVTYQGFYNSKLDWIGIDNIQVVGSMSPSTTMGRTPLSTRLSSNMRVLFMDHMEKEQLQSVYNAYLTPILMEEVGATMSQVFHRLLLGVLGARK